MKTGKIVETLSNQQYHVQEDGSNQVTMCDRHFLCMIHPLVNNPQHFIQGAGLSTLWYYDSQPGQDINRENRLTTSKPELYNTPVGPEVLPQQPGEFSWVIDTDCNPLSPNI